MLSRLYAALPEALSWRLSGLYFRMASRHARSGGEHSERQNEVVSGADGTDSQLQVLVLPVLGDNYMYVVADRSCGDAALVDPVEPARALEAARAAGLRPVAALTTHHHWDHAGGNEELMRLAPSLQHYGGDDRVPCLTRRLVHGDELRLGTLTLRAIHTPAHTTGHLCYLVAAEDDRAAALFSGDALFLGGCGLCFEGNAAQMSSSLDILANLPDYTRIFCGHEYSLQNLMYALHVEPDNTDAQDKLAWVRARRRDNLPTVPSTIGEEKLYNPFLRTSVPQVQQHTKQKDPIDTMRALRAEKDNFKA